MANGRKPRRRASERWWNWCSWSNHQLSIAMYTSLDPALEHSYATFVRGESYTDYIQMPDETRLQHIVRDGGDADGQHDTLSEAWDAWLMDHAEQRAEWDIVPRGSRLQALEAQHVKNPRPFTSEGIVANPDWYRRLYGILGMTDEQFDLFLHLHRFAVAEKDAQRLAKEQEEGTRGTPGPKRRSAAIYLEGYSSDPEYPVVPLETRERACRAYCKRMGYKVHRVYRAMTPPPDDVPLCREIGIGSGHAFVYFRHESDHPFHVVHDLLDARTIDVMVQFVQSGPSYSLFGDDSGESSRLHRMEFASLWEIEPPSEDARRRYELLTRLGDAETEEESSALVEELRTLYLKMKKTKTG